MSYIHESTLLWLSKTAKNTLLLMMLASATALLTACDNRTPVEKAISSCSVFLKFRSFPVQDPPKACSCFVGEHRKILGQEDFDFLIESMIGQTQLSDFTDSINAAHSSGIFPHSALTLNAKLLECL